MVGVTIVEKTVHMTQGPDRTLIHYLCVEPTLRRQGIGTSMLKMIMNQPEYEHKKIVAVISLTGHYKMFFLTTQLVISLRRYFSLT